MLNTNVAKVITTMIYKTSVLSFTVLLIIIGCSNNNQNNTDDKALPEQKIVVVDSNIIKVYVDETGLITANENSISLEALDSSFSKLKASNGMVYYSRANGQGEPPPESMKVMELVIKYEVPIKLFTDKTFTIVVSPN